MRMLLTMRIPVEKGNQALRDGSLIQLMQSVNATLKPEAAYFLPTGGKRTAYIVFDLAEPSMIPQVLEPIFQGLEAEIELSPVMDSDDLRRGIEAAGLDH